MPRGGDDPEDLEDLLFDPERSLSTEPELDLTIETKDVMGVTWTKREWRRVDTGELHHPTEPAAVLGDGTRKWYLDGSLDRKGDLPTIIYPDGRMEFHRRDILHRERAPAVINKSGTGVKEEWRINGKLESVDDQPSRTYFSGTREWHKEDLLHRDSDLPAKINSNGSSHYYKHGKRHRLGAPAIVFDTPEQASEAVSSAEFHLNTTGSPIEAYFEDGICKRSDGGPCKIWPNGDVCFWGGYDDFLQAHIYYFRGQDGDNALLIQKDFSDLGRMIPVVSSEHRQIVIDPDAVTAEIPSYAGKEGLLRKHIKKIFKQLDKEHGENV